MYIKISIAAKRTISVLLIALLLVAFAGCSEHDNASLKPVEVDELFGGVSIGMTENEMLEKSGITSGAINVEGRKIYSKTVIDDERFFVERGFTLGEDNVVDSMTERYIIKVQEKEFTEEEINENFVQSVNNIIALAKKQYVFAGFSDDIFEETDVVSVDIGEKTDSGLQLNILGSTRTWEDLDSHLGKFAVIVAKY